MKAEVLSKALTRARAMNPRMVSANQSPHERQQYLHQYRKDDDQLSDDGGKALRLARAVRHGCLADAYDAAPEELVKEAAIQLDLVLSGDSPDAFDYAYIHNLVQTITLFLTMDSAEAVIAAADACVKTMGYIGNENTALREAWECEDDSPQPYNESKEKKAIDAIESLCERILEKTEALDAASGKRNRAAYEKDFDPGEDS